MDHFHKTNEGQTSGSHAAADFLTARAPPRTRGEPLGPSLDGATREASAGPNHPTPVLLNCS